MDRRIYETVFLGATFFAAGGAVSCPEGTLIIESGGLIGAEYVDSLNEREIKNVTMSTSNGLTFFNEVTARGLRKGSHLYLGPTVYVVSDLLKQAGAQILFITQVTKITYNDAFYELELFGKRGFETVRAKRVVDTTSQGILYQKCSQVPCRKSLNCIVQNAGGHLPVFHNTASGLDTFFCPVDPAAPPEEARRKLHGYFQANQLGSKGVKISFIAQSFAYSLPPVRQVINENWVWIPSVSFDHLLQAYDGGAQWATEVIK